MEKSFSYAVVETNFIKESEFAKYAKGKQVKNYPNPYVKEVDGVNTHIIPADEKIVFRPLTDDEKRWYGIRDTGVVYEGRMTVLGWFPTELVCGVMRSPGYYDRYTENSPLAKKTGYVATNGNFGSKGDAFRASKVQVAVGILRKAGFEVEFNA